MKKLILILMALLMTIVIGCSKSETPKESGDNTQDPRDSGVEIVYELPSDMEVNNPLPGVKTWEKDGRTFYYFSWGVKNTGGYSLELVGLTGNMVTIKAVSPEPGAAASQALTYPWLAISLPKGKYTYKVIDAKGEPITGIFDIKNEKDLMELTLYFPRDGKIVERKVKRDPYLNNEGKTMAQIALEALFGQDEMTGYTDWNINIKGASFNDQQWVILLSDAYKILKQDEKRLLDESITKTVEALKTDKQRSVVITTNPADLPPQQN